MSFRALRSKARNPPCHLSRNSAQIKSPPSTRTEGSAVPPRFTPLRGALHGLNPRGPRCIGRPRAVLLALSVVEGRSSASDRATFGGSRCGGSQPQAAPSLISGSGLLFPVQGLMRLSLNSNRTRKPKQEGQWPVVSCHSSLPSPPSPL